MTVSDVQRKDVDYFEAMVDKNLGRVMFIDLPGKLSVMPQFAHHTLKFWEYSDYLAARKIAKKTGHFPV
jgi:hypothetical protein